MKSCAKHLWVIVVTNLPKKQLPIAAQAEQVVPQAKQLQDGASVPPVDAFPADLTPILHDLSTRKLLEMHPSITEMQIAKDIGRASPVHAFACNDVTLHSGKHQLSLAGQRLDGVRQLATQSGCQ